MPQVLSRGYGASTVLGPNVVARTPVEETNVDPMQDALEYFGETRPRFSADMPLWQQAEKMKAWEQDLQDRYDAAKKEEARNAYDPLMFGVTAGNSERLGKKYDTRGNEIYDLFSGLGNTYANSARLYSNRQANMGQDEIDYANQIAAGGGDAARTYYESQGTDAQAQSIEGLLALARAQQGPSVAEMQMREGYDRAAAENMSIAASQRGGASAAGALMAMGANSAQATQFANQQAILRAQEEDAFRQRQAAVFGQAAGAGSNLQAAEAARVAQNLQIGLAQRNEGIAQKNLSYQTDLAGLQGKADMYTTGIAGRSQYDDLNFNRLAQEQSARASVMVPQENLKFQEKALSQSRKDALTAANYQLGGSALQIAGSMYGGK